jgi:hypothetical protein
VQKVLNSILNIRILVFSVGLLFYFFPALVLGNATVDIFAYVPGCNNELVDNGEQCDGNNLGGSSCQSLGFSGGNLSCTSVCTFLTNQCLLNTGSSQSSGGGGRNVRNDNILAKANIVVTGVAVPLSRITLLIDGVTVSTSFANAEGKFQITVSGVLDGTYTVQIISFSLGGIIDKSQVFLVESRDGLSVKISDVILTPPFKEQDEIEIDTEEAKIPGCPINIYGGQECSLSKVDFVLMRLAFLRGNIQDYKESYDFNNDGSINLTDFSILAYYWTG